MRRPYAMALMTAVVVACVARGSAQQAAPAPTPSQQPQAAPSPSESTTNPSGAPIKDAKQPTQSERRRASSFYLSGAKLYEQGRFE